MPPTTPDVRLHRQDEHVTIWSGDCLDVLRTLPDASVDSVVTDPPYGLSATDATHVVETLTRWLAGERDYLPTGRGFMNQPWDAFVPPPAVWDECFRVLKPGGHLVAFAGARTHDLMGLSVRLAGFEIRDSLAWLYASGMPKSLDVSKAIDKAAGAQRTVLAEGAPVKRMIPGADQNKTGSWIKDNGRQFTPTITAPATDDAARWDGWGTALKPAQEPIILARKPLEGTVAATVLAHGTGALNIDGTRVPGIDPQNGKRLGKSYGDTSSATFGQVKHAVVGGSLAGRWPANVVLSHAPGCVLTGTRKVKAITGTNAGRGTGGNAEQSNVYGTYAGRTDLAPGASVGKGDADGTETIEAWSCVPGCPVAELDEQSGITKDGVASPRSGGFGGGMFGDGTPDRVGAPGYGGQGGASRFFPVFKFQSKAPGRERPNVDGVSHPTVKPLTLIDWLITLVTPPGGTVLDPFLGSGTTAEAALRGGFRCVAVEREATYLPLIDLRLARATEPDAAPAAVGATPAPLPAATSGDAPLTLFDAVSA